MEHVTDGYDSQRTNPQSAELFEVHPYRSRMSSNQNGHIALIKEGVQLIRYRLSGLW